VGEGGTLEGVLLLVVTRGGLLRILPIVQSVGSASSLSVLVMEVGCASGVRVSSLCSFTRRSVNPEACRLNYLGINVRYGAASGIKPTTVQTAQYLSGPVVHVE
jgi:hypothetical protein